MQNPPTTSQHLKQMRRGLLEFAVLQIIANSDPSPSINEMLQIFSRTEFATSEGTLYPLLSKLYKEKIVVRGWEESDSVQGRKYYYLTSKGRTVLSELERYWKTLHATISSIKRASRNHS